MYHVRNRYFNSIIVINIIIDVNNKALLLHSHSCQLVEKKSRDKLFSDNFSYIPLITLSIYNSSMH